MLLALGAAHVLLAEKFKTPFHNLGLSHLHSFIEETQGWCAPTATVIGGFLLWLQRWLGDPKVWDEVDLILQELHEGVFSIGLRRDFNRVTLFKACRFSWRVILSGRNPFSRWLCPMARSSHVSRWTPTRFKVGDSGEFEGVAGKAWVQKLVVHVEDLPDVGRCTEDQKQEYLQRTHSPISYINRKNREFPRSILAIPVETRTNKNWGVLVFDSLDPKLDATQVTAIFRENLKLLGYLL